MAQGRRIAAAVILATALSAAGAATAIALSVPGTTTTVTTPSATVPAVTTPVPTTPSATVPSTTTKVTTPSVSTGSTPSSGGSVTGPKPSATVKSGSTKVTVGGSGGGSASGGGGTGAVDGVVKTVGSTLSSGSSAGRKSTGSGSVLGSAGGSSGSSDSGDSLAASIAGGSGTGASGLASGSGPTGAGFTGGAPGAPGLLAFGLTRSPSGAAGTGRLDPFAAAVASLAGCFYALNPFEQQVLIVRTGLDGREPLTRSQLASALGISPVVIARTEHRARMELEAASASDGCMPVATASALTAFVGGPFGPIGLVTPALAPTRVAQGGGSNSMPAAFAGSSLDDPLASLDRHAQTGPVWAALVIALLLATALTALGREWRRSVY
jgi:hypothetical protein